MLLFRTMLIGVVTVALTACDPLTSDDHAEEEAQVVASPLRPNGIMSITIRNTGAVPWSIRSWCDSVSLEKQTDDGWRFAQQVGTVNRSASGELFGVCPMGSAGSFYETAPGDSLQHDMLVFEGYRQDETRDFRINVELHDVDGAPVGLAVSEPFRFLGDR